MDRVCSDLLSLWGQDMTSQATGPYSARILLWTVTSVLQLLKIFEVLTFEFSQALA